MKGLAYPIVIEIIKSIASLRANIDLIEYSADHYLSTQISIYDALKSAWQIEMFFNIMNLSIDHGDLIYDIKNNLIEIHDFIIFFNKMGNSGNPDNYEVSGKSKMDVLINKIKFSTQTINRSLDELESAIID